MSSPKSKSIAYGHSYIMPNSYLNTINKSFKSCYKRTLYKNPFSRCTGHTLINFFEFQLHFLELHKKTTQIKNWKQVTLEHFDVGKTTRVLSLNSQVSGMMTVCPTIHAFVQIKNKQDNDLIKIETTIFLFYGNSNIK